MKIKQVMKIMKFALENPEKDTEVEVKKKFSEKGYDYFSQYCLGPPQTSFAHYVPDVLKLTPAGVKEYHDLVKERQQRRLNLTMAFATSILAIFSVLNFFFN